MKQIKKDLAAQFACPKCRGRGAHVEEVTLPSVSLTRIPPVAAIQFYAASCALCGYTEFYNLAALARAHAAETQKIQLAENPEQA